MYLKTTHCLVVMKSFIMYTVAARERHCQCIQGSLCTKVFVVLLIQTTSKPLTPFPSYM